MSNRFTQVGSFLIVAVVCVSLQRDANGLDIHSDFNDGFLEIRDNLPPQNPWPQVHPDTIAGLPGHNAGESWRANVGEWFGPGLTTTVLPFKLPGLGDVANPFTSAGFGVMVFEIGNATVTNIDLYGLGDVSNPASLTRTDPAILTTDWYIGSTSDPTATLIQEDFLTPSSSSGFVGAPNNITDAVGDSNLQTFLNTAYDGGNGAGEYVFLRLSYGADTLAAGFDAYKITVREAALQGEWPVITVGTNTVVGDVSGNGIIDEDLEIDFGPIRDNWLETDASFGMQLARSDGDLNLDGMVSIADFREWKDAYLAIYGNEQAVLAAAASLDSLSVPEPSTLLSLGIGLIGFVCWRSRRS